MIAANAKLCGRRSLSETAPCSARMEKVMRIAWKIWVRGPKWCGKWFAVHNDLDQIDGVLCAGITVFGVSLIYSDWW